MSKKIALVHTSLMSVELMRGVLSQVVPSAEIINIVDEYLGREIIEANRITPRAIRRFCSIAVSTEDLGAKAILSTCSSASEAVDTARQLCNIPIVRIDEPMVQEALRVGEKIGVVATVKDTLGPTRRLIEKEAGKLSKKVDIKIDLCDAAYRFLAGGNVEKHDEMLLESVKELSKEADVILLAQASMSRIVPLIGNDIKIPVFSSPRLAAEKIKEIIVDA